MSIETWIALTARRNRADDDPSTYRVTSNGCIERCNDSDRFMADGQSLCDWVVAGKNVNI
jgi:hypothetical protein